MKKRWIAFCLVLACCLFAGMPVSAAENSASAQDKEIKQVQEMTGNDTYRRLMDEADLLTEAEEQKLLSALDEISERQGMDVVVVTTYSLGGKSAQDFADDYFDYNGYGQGSRRSGVLLLHSPQYRDWWISTRGAGITAFTDAGIDYIGEQITPLLADGENADAYMMFAQQCDRFITQAKTGKPFDVGTLPRAPLPLWSILVCIGIGCVIAALIVGGMRQQLRSVRLQPAANDYVRPGSMQVTQHNDIFLYRHVSRRAKPQGSSSSGGSSTHRSSSGATHGGGGGKY